MLDVENTWRQLVYPWFTENNPHFFNLRGRWGSDYCLDKFLKAVREDTPTLPAIHGLLSQCETKVTYYFLAVDDPEYQRWLPICRVDYGSIMPNYGTPILILRKSDHKLGYLDRETLCFSPDEDISRFIWAKGSAHFTPIRVASKSKTYILEILERAKEIHESHLWDGNSDNDNFAGDTIISASELLPSWGSKEMFFAHLPNHPGEPQWVRIDKVRTSESEKSEQEVARISADYEKRIEAEKAEKSEILGIVKIMAENSKVTTNQTTINAPGSNIAAINSGHGSIQSVSQVLGSNLDEITQLIQSLQTIVQTFPEEQKAEIEIALDDLEIDLADENKREPNRLRKRISTLWLATCTIAVGVAGITDFSNNLLELSEKLNVSIPIELIQQNLHIFPGG